MDLMIQLIGIVAAVAGVWMTWWTYLSNKRLDVFHLYVDKFHQIISAEDMLWWSAMMRGEQPAESERVHCEIKMVLYLNLVWEEYFLYREGLIAKRLWRLWEPNIVMVLKTPFCQTVFNRHRLEFSTDFCDWVERVTPAAQTRLEAHHSDEPDRQRPDGSSAQVSTDKRAAAEEI